MKFSSYCFALNLTASSSNEPITDARLVDDQRRPRRFGFELLAKRADRDAKIFDLAFLGGPPDRSQQLRVSKDPAALFGELGEDRIFLGGQVNRFAVPGHRTVVKVDSYCARFDRLLAAVGGQIREIV